MADRIKRIAASFGSCEEINDSYDTSPSKRLAALSVYRKGKSVQADAGKICKCENLTAVRRACPHFSAWLSKLETLNN